MNCVSGQDHTKLSLYNIFAVNTNKWNDDSKANQLLIRDSITNSNTPPLVERYISYAPSLLHIVST